MHLPRLFVQPNKLWEAGNDFALPQSSEYIDDVIKNWIKRGQGLKRGLLESACIVGLRDSYGRIRVLVHQLAGILHLFRNNGKSVEFFVNRLG